MKTKQMTQTPPRKTSLARRASQICLAALVAFAPANAAVAQDSSGVYISGAERIEIGDRIRMHSQRISVMTCMMDAGVNVEGHRTAILDAMAEVDGLLVALKDGDTELNIAVPESDRRMLQAIRGVKLQWELFREATNLRLNVGADAVGPDYVSRQNLNLMHASKYLVSQTVNHYTIPPALLQSDAFTLQIAARQRSLAQQLAKESCAVMTGNDVMGSRTRLRNATKRFDASFNALVNGFPAAGVSAPETQEIRSGLADMSAAWQQLRDNLNAVDGPSEVSDMSDLVTGLDDLMEQYDRLVPLYVAESKSGL